MISTSTSGALGCARFIIEPFLASALYHGPVEQAIVPVLVVLGILFLLWYIAGNELMRRRGRRLAVWCKQVADRYGAKQTIKWYTLHSFRLEVQSPSAPFESLALTGLTESWDVPVIWLWNRLNWRRDMVLVQLTLQRQPMFGFELYRPRAVLAGDARHAARQEGWPGDSLDGFRLAAPNDAARDLA